MALRNPPLWILGQSHTAENDRLAGTQGLVGTAGVSAGTNDLLVTQASTPAMTVNVNSGWGWVLGTVSSTQGMYTVYNDATLTGITVSAANATLPRIDRVVLSVLDSNYSGVTSSASVYVVAGTASASPVAPAIPASSISLATLAIASGATAVTTANITDTRVRASMALPPPSSTLSGYAPLSTPQAGLTTSTLSQSQMAQVLSVSTSSQTITLPTSGITAGYSTTLIAQAVSFTLAVPSGVTVYGTPSGTVTNASITIPANASFTLYNVSSSVWYYLAGGALPKASVSSSTGSPATGANGSKTYYKWTTVGTATVTLTAGTLDLLVVGGGGSGGTGTNCTGGGGGAGGVNYLTSVYFPAGTYTLTVGAGGASGTSTNNGGSSSINGIIGVGGGVGGQVTYVSGGGSGGSGGGATGGSTVAGTATTCLLYTSPSPRD